MCKHPAYGQSLLKLGIHLSDPIVELGTVWARGDHASARLIHHAILSAEHLRQGRDKMLARVAGSIINKLTTYHEEAERFEGRRHKSPYAAGSLVGRRNPHPKIPPKNQYHMARGWWIELFRFQDGTWTAALTGPKDEEGWEIGYIAKRSRASALKAAKELFAKVGPKRGSVNARRRNPRTRPNENEIPTVIIKRAKRNPPISKSDAAAMCRVLRHHGYTCTKKGAKRSKARR